MRNQFYVSACIELEDALMEIQRPEEDVVSAGACYHARRAIENFLRFYLLQFRKNTDSYGTIEELLQASSIYTNTFKNEAVEIMRCSKCAGAECYCLENADVNKCVSFAKRMKELVKI